MMKKWNDPEALLESQRYDNPIPSRTLISSLVEKSDQGMTYDDVAQAFQLEDENSLEALRRRLGAMIRDGQLIRIGQTYQLCNDDQEYDALVDINQRGQGFAVIKDRDDLLLSERELRLVFNGDRIRVRPTSIDRRGRTQGFITEVIKHQVQQVIGELCEHEGEFYVQPSAPNTHQPVTLEKELVEHAGLRVGDAVRIAIDDYPTREEFATGHVIKSMANQADTQIIIPATILEYGLPYEFPQEVIAEAEKFKEPSARDRKNRVDLRDLPLVTIDGEDARDFDDAVYAEKRPGGGYRVIVAIADVSHYVNVGKPLDDEAQQRGTSVYFPHYVLPMLPEALSNGLCSLNPDVDRLCMVCDLNLSRAGRVTKYEFYPAVMHSQARLTYTQVAQYLAGDSQAIVNNAAIHKSINTLFQLYQTLLQLREQRHAMEFETVETYMTFDDKGAIKEILPRSRNDAHKLIEECMLLANVAAADFALTNDVPMLYRVHEPPEFSRIQKVRDYVKLLGLSFPEQPTQADYQRVIEATKDRIDATSIHAVLLRSMMQAYYAPKNAGHYGLAYEAYTHFTSPIRRYPDLLLHRAIKAKLAEKPYPLQGAALDAAGEHYSQTERRADEASRDVTAWLKCHYMQQHLGEEFTGVITAVTDFGMFVTLSDLYVDGMIHISQLGDDYFVYDAALQRLTGQHQGQVFALGDKVVIKVAAVNLEERKLDFVLVKQVSSAGRLVRGKAPRSNSTATPRSTRSRTAAKEPQQYDNTSTGNKPVRKKRTPTVTDNQPNLPEQLVTPTEDKPKKAKKKKSDHVADRKPSKDKGKTKKKDKVKKAVKKSKKSNAKARAED
ncbi:ribonuclease R [Acinetobacter qingfengensis]|uniref:Ribonuclease R n=1 Tax=Acinetobacter qingfengensis TaxID=1262585 RepID=A0A1E7QXI6_9GAMM|nr:ribonuclease R [Acinetobacter qingfengensis]KAA8731659.1 ribonuclease R [Acinetobacter qingfengensis]OEY91761.1 ribonuclease R [Acinetobacter qingfengensis]